MAEHILYLGYWYQRTSLHLSEVYDFLKSGKSPLDLRQDKLKELLENLSIKHISFNIDILEFIEIETTSHINIKYFEDGLVIFSIHFQNIKEAIKKLSEYFENKFVPAIGYLFSLGAPVPKEMSHKNIKFTFFLTAQNASKETINNLLKELDEAEYYEFNNEDADIYRGDTHFIINSKKNNSHIPSLIEMFIFFSEFKAQLHCYLNLHRDIWEKIEVIKEQGYITGKEIGRQRSDLEGYKKTIDLIDGRMQQMGSYMSTRSSMVQKSGWDDILTNVLAFKYDNLHHSLDYVTALWKMTRQYVDSAILLFNEINQTSTKNAVNALTVISSIGMVGLILTTLSKTEIPPVTTTGIYYLILLLSISYFIQRFINYIFRVLKYKINEADYKKNI